jgi:O-antigen/teichoic acid export membrane protein
MITSTIIYGLASTLPALLGFVLLPLYSKHLSTGEYGIIASMGVLSGVISVFSNLALDRAAFRFYFDSNIPADQRKVLGTFFIGSISVSIISFFILIISKPLLIMAFPEINFYPYYFLTIITVSLGVCEGFVMGYLRISEKFFQYLFLIFLTVFLQGGLILYFVFINNMGALGQMQALLFTSLILLPVFLTIAYKNFSIIFDWQLFKKGILFAWPFIPSLIIAWILNWSNSIFIAHYFSLDEVGLFAMAYKISMVFFLITGAFAIAFQPIFFRKANEENQIFAKQSIYSIIHLLSRFFIALGFLFAFFSEDIIRFLLDEKYKEIHLVIRILLLSHIFAGILGISSNLYYLQSKRSKLQLAVVCASAVASLILNYLLVPMYGIYGAAFATVFSIFILTYMNYSFSKRCYFINIYWRKLLVLIFVSVLVIILFQIFIEGLWISLPLKIFTVIMMTVFLINSKKFLNSIRDFKMQF